jgi:hypothetical protein
MASAPTGAPPVAGGVWIQFKGRVVMVGCGSIGQGTIPLVIRHLGVAGDRIDVVTADERGRAVAERFGVASFRVTPLKPGNIEEIMGPLVSKADFVVNLSVDVSSRDLQAFCAAKGAFYLDTCTEPWPGGYTSGTVSSRSNYGQVRGDRWRRGPWKVCASCHAVPCLPLSRWSRTGVVGCRCRCSGVWRWRRGVEAEEGCRWRRAGWGWVGWSSVGWGVVRLGEVGWGGVRSVVAMDG